MKKSFFLCMGMMLLSTIGLTSCNNDDDETPVEVSGVEKAQDQLIGSWNLIKEMNGQGIVTLFNPGEVIFTFSKNNELKINGINEEKSPFRFQTSHYLCATIDGSNLNQGVKTGILLDEISSTFYIIDFKDDKLFLYRNNEEIIDGEGYTFQRVSTEPNLNPHPSSRK